MKTINDVVKESSNYLTFKMNRETFAADVANVQIILELSKVTKVPKSPDYFLGVIDFRGTVLPLIDPRIKFGLETWENTINTCILVLEIELDKKPVKCGILVDKVEEVIEIGHDHILDVPKIGNKYKAEILKGMFKYDDNFIMILDINKIFSVDELEKIITKPSEISTAGNSIN